MKLILVAVRVLAVLVMASFAAHGAEGRVRLQLSDNRVLVKVDGDKDDDWWIQSSTNLTTWATLTNLSTLLSGNETNAPLRPVGDLGDSPRYYRALRTAGLYDPSLFRTVNLEFTSANWNTQLANGRTYQTNTPCWLYLDNGATNFGVGARYKGNSSYLMAGTKKSINLELDYIIPDADLMNYETVNLNNAAGDETIMREPLFFTIMSRYTPCPEGSMCGVHVNGSFWGVYSLIQQENGQLISEWFPSNNGDRWRAPNLALGQRSRGGFASSNSAFAYLGNKYISTYVSRYELKTANVATNIAWQRLINMIYVLNTTPITGLRDRAEDVLAVDNWLWFLALENLFVDDDSYWYKGADYGFYYEPESGRMHPVEHDGNEVFTATTGIDYRLSPVSGATGNNRPLLYRFLAVPELRQRYLAHMRTVLQESFDPTRITPLINQFHRLSIDAIIADPNKGFTMAAYTNELIALKNYVTNRYNFLINHSELTPVPPNIVAVYSPKSTPIPGEIPYITAQVAANGSNGINSVWLYHRGKSYGRFNRAQMFDDGLHGDGMAGDGIFGAQTTNYLAGAKVRYYVEARSANSAQAASFSPARAENATYSYRVGLITATDSPVILNELMADNATTYADPQGEYNDWIELRNISEQTVDLTGHYLSDESDNPRKWQFPTNTTISAGNFLVVWADEQGTDSPGLHANFKLSKSGETIYLADTDGHTNAVLDSIAFGEQITDKSYGRSSTNEDVWTIMTPTPDAANQ